MIVELYDKDGSLMKAFDEVDKVEQSYVDGSYSKKHYKITFKNIEKEPEVVEHVEKVKTKKG